MGAKVFPPRSSANTSATFAFKTLKDASARICLSADLCNWSSCDHGSADSPAKTCPEAFTSTAGSQGFSGKVLRVPAFIRKAPESGM